MQMVLNEIYLFYITKLCYSLMRHFAYYILWIAHNVLSICTTNHSLNFLSLGINLSAHEVLFLRCLKTFNRSLNRTCDWPAMMHAAEITPCTVPNRAVHILR
jgi:hypothetical protein